MERREDSACAFTISMNHLKRLALARTDGVISPELPRTSGQMSFVDRDRLIAAGERAGTQALEQIRAIFPPVQAEIHKQVTVQCKQS